MQALIQTFGTQLLEDLGSSAALLLVQHRHHRVSRVGHDGTEDTSCTQGANTSVHLRMFSWSNFTVDMIHHI